MFVSAVQGSESVIVVLVAKSGLTPWTVAHQVPLSMGFPRREYWSGFPFPSPGELPWRSNCISCFARILYHEATRKAHFTQYSNAILNQQSGDFVTITLSHSL